jgi:hypothetical protein
VLLFGTKGNTRASECGTARLQSRFFIAPRAIKAEHCKADDRFFAYVLIFDIVDLPQKERNFADLCEIICVCQNFVVLLQRKSLNNKKKGILC